MRCDFVENCQKLLLVWRQLQGGLALWKFERTVAWVEKFPGAVYHKPSHWSVGFQFGIFEH